MHDRHETILDTGHEDEAPLQAFRAVKSKQVNPVGRVRLQVVSERLAEECEKAARRGGRVEGDVVRADTRKHREVKFPLAFGPVVGGVGSLGSDLVIPDCVERKIVEPGFKTVASDPALEVIKCFTDGGSREERVANAAPERDSGRGERRLEQDELGVRPGEDGTR